MTLLPAENYAMLARGPRVIAVLAYGPAEVHAMQHVLGMHGFMFPHAHCHSLSVCAPGHHRGLQAWGANSPDGGFRRRKDHTHGRAG